MPIARLPPQTVHTISSSQVLTDSCSVVKELVDNSLDAEADAVFIEVSLNALDIIQVRDNGHGIIPDDRRMVGKRHCTSKIRDLADLESIGGKFLGFRGEALASAAELSASMTVSTRTEGEATAVSLTIGRKGEIVKEERVSLPVGTTVRVNSFLNAIPVRRQTALKTGTKSLVKIKKLLQAYALARPSVRFSLKILKAKNDNGNWMYAPKNGDSILEAARKILSRDAVEQCQWKLYEPLQADAEKLVAHGDSAPVQGSYKIEALLPKPKYDPHIVSNIGQFISVDSRPVSCARGTFKQIVGLYKSYLGTGTLIETSDKPKDPILCMHISCPQASYDVNVEPAKDDVLFTSVDFVLGMLDAFFKEIYGDTQTKVPKSPIPLALNTIPRGFEVLLARKREPLASAPSTTFPSLDSTSRNGAHISSRLPVTVLKQTLATPEGYSNTKSRGNGLRLGVKEASSPSNRLHAENRHLGGSNAEVENAENVLSANNRQIRQPNAYSDVLDVLSSSLCANRRTDGAQGWDGEEGLGDPSVCNPWTFAKINTPIRQHVASRKANHQLLTPGYQTGELDEIMGSRAPEVKKSMKPIRHGLPTPQRAHACQRVSATFHSSSPEPYPFSENDSGRSPENTSLSTHLLPKHASDGFGTLDSWIQRPSDDHPRKSPSSDLDSFDQQDQGLLRPDTRDLVSAHTILMGSPRGEFPHADENVSSRLSSPRSLARVEPTIELSLPDNELRNELVGIVPRKKLTQYSHDTRVDCDPASAVASVSAQSKDDGCSFHSNRLSNIPSVHPDLAKALDYEVRKQAAVKQWRANQNAKLLHINLSHTPSSSAPSPHQNRYRQAVATLRHPTSDDSEATPAPEIEYNDPRACLIRAQEQDKSNAFPRGARKRRKSSSLPLERVHEQSTVRDLTCIIDTTNIHFHDSVGKHASSGKPYDTYLSSGMIFAGLSSQGLTIGLVRAWEERVRELLKMSYKTNKNINDVGRIEAGINFWPLMQTHLAAYP